MLSLEATRLVTRPTAWPPRAQYKPFDLGASTSEWKRKKDGSSTDSKLPREIETDWWANGLASIYAHLRTPPSSWYRSLHTDEFLHGTEGVVDVVVTAVGGKESTWRIFENSKEPTPLQGYTESQFAIKSPLSGREESFANETALFSLARQAGFSEGCARYVAHGDNFLVTHWEGVSGDHVLGELASRDFSETTKLYFACRTVEALACFERAGWRHGDVKEANVVFASHGRARLVDLSSCFIDKTTTAGEKLVQKAVFKPWHTSPPSRLNIILDDKFRLGIILFDVFSSTQISLKQLWSFVNDFVGSSSVFNANRDKFLNQYIVDPSIRDILRGLLQFEPRERKTLQTTYAELSLEHIKSSRT